MANIFEELTDQTRSLVENSLSLAIGNKNPEALSLHMLWALVADSSSILNQIFNKTNVSKDAVLLDIKSRASKLLTSSNVSRENIKVSSELVNSLENAKAVGMGHHATAFSVAKFLTQVEIEIKNQIFLYHK